VPDPVLALLDEARRVRDDIARLMDGPASDPVDLGAVAELLAYLGALQSALDDE
jgi:hypothetical protein